MNRTTKRAVKAILEEGLVSGRCVGDLLAPVLFPTGRRALYLSSDGQVTVLSSGRADDARIFTMQLIEFMGVMQELETNALIYVVPGTTDDYSRLWYEGRTEFRHTQDPDVVEIGCGRLFHTDTISISGSDEKVLTAFQAPAALHGPLMRYLAASVFPGSGLEDYVRHGFRTAEAFRARRANLISWIAVAVAFVIGVASIILSLRLDCN